MKDRNPLVAILQRKFAVDAGILPLADCPLTFDFNRFLASLPPDEARVMKRKFRKLWRKISREVFEQISEDPAKMHGKISRNKATMRKNMVANHFFAKALRMTNEIARKNGPKQ